MVTSEGRRAMGALQQQGSGTGADWGTAREEAAAVAITTGHGTGLAGRDAGVVDGAEERKRRVDEIEAARDEQLLRLFSLMRAEVDGDRDGDATSDGVTNVRAELVFRRVLTQLEERRRRGTWLQRALRPVIAALAALAGSRAVRLLMP
jgi:hypothetical protein